MTGLQCTQCLDGYWNFTASNSLGCQGIGKYNNYSYTTLCMDCKSGLTYSPTYNIMDKLDLVVNQSSIYQPLFEINCLDSMLAEELYAHYCKENNP